MTQEDRDFIREYCETYNVEMIPGPGVPCLNGVPLVGEALRQLFMPTESTDASFYVTTAVETSKLTKKKESFSKEFIPSFYRSVRHSWNVSQIQVDKLAS